MTANLQQVLTLLPDDWQAAVLASSRDVLSGLQEVRIRQGRPVMAYATLGEYWLTEQGFSQKPHHLVLANDASVRFILATISHSSLYALEEELRSGYLTVPGGHRVGLVGRAVLENGRVRTLKYITGFNLRFAREVVGCSTRLLPQLLRSDGQPMSTLLISPPQAGKTTLLRDLVRSLSYGVNGLTIGCKLVVIDERSELAACYQGVPTLDLGPRTDVLDACPKAEGMTMALRSLSPQVLVTDEIGRQEDAEAIVESLHAGVTVLSSAHAADWQELQRRPVLRELVRDAAFERYVLLSSRLGPGTVEAVLDRTGGVLSCHFGSCSWLPVRWWSVPLA